MNKYIFTPNRERRADKSKDTTKSDLGNQWVFLELLIGIWVSRSINDSKTIASPKPATAWVTDHKGWKPEVCCMIYRQIGRLEKSFPWVLAVWTSSRQLCYLFLVVGSAALCFFQEDGLVWESPMQFGFPRSDSWHSFCLYTPEEGAPSESGWFQGVLETILDVCFLS